MAYPIYHGVDVNFGISGSITGINGAFQSRDVSQTSGQEEIMDGVGNYVETTFYGAKEEASFTYVATAAGGPTGAATITTSSCGASVTITDTRYPAIAGTSWKCLRADVNSSNTTAARVTLQLVRYPGIS